MRQKGMLCKIVSWVCDRPVAGAIGMCISVVSVRAVLVQASLASESCCEGGGDAWVSTEAGSRASPPARPETDGFLPVRFH